MQKESDDLILVGKLLGAHGIKGYVKIQSFTDNPRSIESMTLVDEEMNNVNIKIQSRKNSTLICSINNILNRNDAESLGQKKLFTYLKNLPKTQRSEHYIESLKRLEVKNTNKDTIGVILAVHNFGAGDILEIEFNNKTTTMLPFTFAIFPEINEKYIVMDCDKAQFAT